MLRQRDVVNVGEDHVVHLVIDLPGDQDHRLIHMVVGVQFVAMKHFVVKEKLWSYCGVIGKQEVTKGIVMARMS